MARSRTRRIAKWTGVVVCVLLLGAFEASHRWRGAYWAHGYYAAQFDGGAIRFRYWNRRKPRAADWIAVRQTGRTYSNWRFRYSSWSRPSAQFHSLTIPLWAPFLAVAIPTIWLWRRNRPYPPGHCRKCGYDLTGNVTGKCSECAEPISIAKTL